MSTKRLLIRDVTLRDGQQSLFATRMKQEQINKVLPFYKEAGFYAMEVWGGAVPDAIMRYLDENPWDRLESISKEIGNTSKLTALSRGRNLFGYSPYPDHVIEGFCKNSIQSGVGIMRIFDALNDLNNMESSIKYVKQNGGIADCCICYTVDPKFNAKDRLLAKFGLKKIPKKIFSIDYFVEKAKMLEQMGADMISIKDMAGLITPSKTAQIIKRLKNETSLPIDFHTHCTPGYGIASSLMAIINGVDILDTSIMSFSGGPAAPSFELIQIFCQKLKIETGVNLNAVNSIDKELRDIRLELKEYDTYTYPKSICTSKLHLPEEVNEWFDKCIEFAKNNDEENLLDYCQRIEAWFEFPAASEEVKNAEIPGGMYTNMLAQLKVLKLEHLLEKVLLKVPEVRLAAGCPPLVTPTSQIIGVQAVNVVIDENEGKPPYTKVSNQFFSLVQGQYGKTPIPIDPDFRLKITGVSQEKAYNLDEYKKQENPILKEFGNVKLAENEKEELLLELFPQVAEKFLRTKKERNYNQKIAERKSDEEKKYSQERENFLKLSEEERNKRLQHGLYNYNWKTLV